MIASAPMAPSIEQPVPGGSTARRRLGVLGPVFLTSGLGLLAIGAADAAARRGEGWSEPLFWLGIVVLIVPFAVALWSPRPSRTERIALVLTVGLVLYAVRFLYSPGSFAFFDEFSHWRTAIDISTTGRLFTSNPLQPISTLYPGLEAITSMLAALGGVPVAWAGAMVIGVGRVVVVLGLFVVFERAAGSARVAGLGVLLYAANSSFVLFDSLFLYESLCLALAATALAVLTMRLDAESWTAHRLSVLAAVTIAAAVVTHHVTSYALVGLVAVWAAIGLIRWRRGVSGAPVMAAVFGIAAASFWLFAVAAPTVSYIAPHLEGGVRQVLQLIAGESTARTLFQDKSGVTASITERFVAYATVALILLSLPPGLWTIYRRLRRQHLALALALTALLYPTSLGLRLTSLGAETAGRLSAFAFVGVAFAAALWGVNLVAAHESRILRRALTVMTVVVFVGGIVGGTAPWSRLPYPYRPAADSRSIDAESIAAAQWTLAHLGEHRHFVTDRSNRQLLGSFGRQEAGYSDDDATILLGTDATRARLLILRNHIEFVLVDRRLTTAVPLVSGYVVVGELGGVAFKTPLGRAAFDKFDAMAGASRIFDSGDIQIYDVSRVR